jgi:predicted nucleotidyltransferase
VERVIEERRVERERALNTARRFIECVEGRVKLALALVYGSYARGDFNEWSDIDVLLVVEDNLPRNPLKRLELMEDCLLQAPGVEPLILSTSELEKLLEKNQLIKKIIEEGITLIGNKKDLL